MKVSLNIWQAADGMKQTNLSAWENRTETRSGGLSGQMAIAAQATLNQPGTKMAVGDVLPPSWHWFAFLPDAPTEGLGNDGHPPLGGFLPALELNRRMWAGGKLVFHQPLHVGEALKRVSKIRKIREKEGAAGRMVFITVDHQISGESGLAVEERHDIVYLAIPDTFTPPQKQDALTTPDFVEPVGTSPTLLFRYSAITFNSHRIHYDLAYVQEVEKYPGLVVHGPLQATLMLDAATRHGGGPPRTFSFRGVHPVFADEPMSVMGRKETDGAMSLCTAVTADTSAYQGMQATATWEEET